MRLFSALFLATILSAVFAFAADRGVELSDMDRKADPCTDFFDYANGAWRAQNPIPAYMDRWSRRWQAGENNKEQLKNILDDVSARQDWAKGSVDQLIGDYHGACMNEARANQLGLKPLQPMLRDIDAVNDTSDLQRVIARLHDIAVPVPFGLTDLQDPHAPAQVISDVYASGLGLPDRDYYVKTEQRFQDARAKYRVYVANIFKLAGYSEADAKAASDTVFRMETKLAEASLDNVALRDPKNIDHKFTVPDLQKLTPGFDWNAYFKATNVPAGPLNVDQPKFMEEVQRQLRDDSLADWKTYLKWQLLNSAADSLSEPFVEEKFNFYGRYLSGEQEMKPRWKRCAESADQWLGEALGQEYVKRYFPPAAKARTQEMVRNILAAMKQTIEGLDWMGPDTKKRALAKLATFNVKVGYPDKWKDYSHVVITRDSFWDDVVAGRRFVVNDHRAQIGKPVDRDRWGMTPPTSNAYYNPQLNEIVFPAGILQPPAFSMDAVDAVNYGSIGVVIGHEISHGFDDQGAQFDASGALNNWWTSDDLTRFESRTKCVSDQFDGYFIEPGIHHNGKLVLGESIGDLAGAKIAFLAFHLSRQGKPPAPTIDGFTPDQQFFIAWGQFRGDETRPETQRLMVQGDPHPVAKYRVIGPLSNMPAFQEAFHCKAGSPMVRPADQRCEVW